MKLTTIKRLFLLTIVSVLVSCGHSVTNVWDYYIKNNVEVHVQDSVTITKSQMLYRVGESVTKSQLEFIAFKQDTQKYLVIGSHKIAKTFWINDTVYAFDVKSLYSKVRGDDFIRQLGDLNIYFTHVPMENIEKFLNYLPIFKTTFKATRPVKNETVYIDYQLSPTVYISCPKSNNANNPSDVVLWVGKRKHLTNMSRIIDIMNDMRAFK